MSTILMWKLYLLAAFFFYFCLQVLDFGRTWQLGASGGMENGPRGFGCDLLVILQIFEKSIKIEKC